MKLVIDLPDEVVKWFKEKGFIPIGQYLMVDEAMKKAKPLSEVLNGIKVDINENGFTIQENDGSYTHVISTARLKYLIDKWEYIIEKHIGKAESEVKPNDNT